MHDILVYDPQDWFWRVDGKSGIYSSAARGYLNETSQEVNAFLNAKGSITPIASEEELKVVLRAQYPAGLPPDLPGYTAERRWQLEVGGITVNGMPVDTSRESQALIHGAFSLAQINAEASFRFKAGDVFLTLNSAQIIAIGQAVAEHVQACFAWEAGVLEAISAGEISSEAGIDLAVQNF